ncbi:MAG: APC family permease [Acidobacteriota bacterium]|jgi:APA family basic amino acid/polyamine antiporter
MDRSTTSESQLHRELSRWGATAFVVTNMIGTGIFTVPAFVRAATGNGLTALLVWALGGGLALCGALCYAELSTRMPEAGGEYQYLSRVFGPLWGFVSGWISFLAGFSAAIAAAALGASAYASSLFGWSNGQVVIPELGITLGSLMAAGLILLLALFHSLGVRPGGRLQTIIAGTVTGGILLLIIGGFLTGEGDWPGVLANGTSGGMWWIALIQVSFAYSGWNAAAYLAGEVRDPRRTLPWALIGGTIIVALLYLGLNLLFLYAVPADSWTPTIAIGKVAAERLFGSRGSLAISAIITVTILGSVSAMTAAGPRVYYAMARDGLAPAFFGRVGRSQGVPTIAILVQALVSIILVLTGEFETLLIYIGSALSLIAALTVTAVWFVRRGASNEGVFLTPGYPVTPAIFLGLELTAFVLGLKERPVPTGAALLTILVGMGVYLATRRKSSRQ